MKAVWITCSVLCVCALICSGVLFLAGRSLLHTTIETNSSADEYALKTVNAIGKSWDARELISQLDSSAEPGLADRVVAQGKALGPLTWLGPFTATNTSISDVNGLKTTSVTVNAAGTFKNGSANVRLKLDDTGGGWKIREFLIAPTSAAGSKSI
jgi:hypothetical protein